MLVKFLDRKTGNTAISPNDCSTFWWTEGNGVCDCNRITAFPQVDENQYLLELGLEEDGCLGKRRFIAVDVTGDLEGKSKVDLIFGMNFGY